MNFLCFSQCWGSNQGHTQVTGALHYSPSPAIETVSAFILTVKPFQDHSANSRLTLAPGAD